MGKHTFKTALNFEQVETGSAEDNVLVRTAEGDVKEVARDEFGGGGSQDLQSVLNNGSVAETANIHLNEYSSINLTNNLGSFTGTLQLSTWNGIDIVASNTVPSLNLGYGEVKFKPPVGTSGEVLMRVITPLDGQYTLLNVPSKPTGEYTLATLDDIPTGGSQDLQSILNNGAYAEFDGTSNLATSNLRLMEPDGEGGREFAVNISGEASNATQFQSTADNIQMFKNTPTGTTTFRILNPVANTIINLPDPTVDGTYTLATLEDIPSISVNNIPADANGNVDLNLNNIIKEGENLVTGNPQTGDQYIKFKSFDPATFSIFNSSGANMHNSSIGQSFISFNGLSIFANNGTYVYYDIDGIGYNGNGVYKKFHFPIPLDSFGRTIPISANGNFADTNGNITLSSISTTFTTNDGKIVTVTNGIITNIE
jgi:hypothetical protein